MSSALDLDFAGGKQACSEECRDLIGKILVTDEGQAPGEEPKEKKQRITLKEIMAHPW